MTLKAPRHPGHTKAQRRALDEIGCGELCPRMSRRTRQALLDAGLIYEIGPKVLGLDRFGKITIPQYQMPLSVHYQWCQHQAAEYDREVADGRIPPDAL